MVVEQPKTTMQKILYMKKRLALNAAWDAAAAREASAVCANKSMVWAVLAILATARLTDQKTCGQVW